MTLRHLTGFRPARPAMAAAFIAAAIALGTGPSAADGHAAGGMAVVELFTSQGCSSCPPADANLAVLGSEPGILALSFGVTFWDYLGWKDTFAQPAFTARQLAYERALGHPGAFTPQVVVNGRADAVGNDLPELRDLIATTGRPAADGIAFGDDTVLVRAAGGAPSGTFPADVWLVTWQPGTTLVPVARGENGGRTLPISNVVRSLVRLGGWAGEATTFNLPAAGDGQAQAVLVQDPQGGRIIAAARR